jgi:hypothetical protein
MGSCCSCDIESYGIESYGYNRELNLKKDSKLQNYGSRGTKELQNEPSLVKHYYLYS